MNKKLSILVLATAISAAFCFTACGNDKPAQTTAASTSAPTTSAAETTAAASENKETAASSAAANSDGIPKVGDIYKGKKVGSVEKIPDCNDDKHGVIYIYDENEDIIDTIKY